jgi:hypothetical protein
MGSDTTFFVFTFLMPNHGVNLSPPVTRGDFLGSTLIRRDCWVEGFWSPAGEDQLRGRIYAASTTHGESRLGPPACLNITKVIKCMLPKKAALRPGLRVWDLGDDQRFHDFRCLSISVTVRCMRSGLVVQSHDSSQTSQSCFSDECASIYRMRKIKADYENNVCIDPATSVVQVLCIFDLNAHSFPPICRCCIPNLQMLHDLPVVAELERSWSRISLSGTSESQLDSPA